jgi:hypothetical protein
MASLSRECWGLFLCLCLSVSLSLTSSHPLSCSTLWMSSAYFQLSSPDLVVNGLVFSAAQQYSIYTQSVAAWYCTVIANQFWHVWVCKTRSVSIFTHGLLDNVVTLAGVAMSLTTACVFTYIPGLQPFFFTNTLAGPIWACSLVYGAYMIIYTEYVKFASRTNPSGWVAKNLAW